METGKGFAPHGVNWGPKEGWKWHKVQIEAVGSGDWGGGVGGGQLCQCSLLRRQWSSITEGEILLEFTGK